MTLDCEYDAFKETNLKAPCKVTLVNDKGEIVLDTLINQRGPEGEVRKLRREVWIHGISSSDLEDAPTFEEVKKHIFSILDKEKTILVGHSTKQDLIVMELIGYRFLDTSLI